jgi:hypothetical protein
MIACPLARGGKIQESFPRVHTWANTRALQPLILRARVIMAHLVKDRSRRQECSEPTLACLPPALYTTLVHAPKHTHTHTHTHSLTHSLNTHTHTHTRAHVIFLLLLCPPLLTDILSLHSAASH